MKETTIKTSWEINAERWIKVMDNQEIASRIFTNEAVVNLLKNSKANKILDIGCGEGWLTRAITNMGKTGIGIDATAILLENAKEKGKETYYHLSYKDLSEGKKLAEAPFEAIVFNFCIYQNEELIPLLKKLRESLTITGEIIIQTMHPFFLIQNSLPYTSQWIPDSWKGLSGNFSDGHAWYARTFEGWLDDFQKAGLILNEIIEVTNQDLTPVSVIFKTQVK
ncbi:ubiquinone/menaquinone biosynthesis C-methylase UbiE [Gelidibacter algens]|jgi:2-polyprenyl-3-methyl-5-hydroxy-6-metoxy-1,4-benzoquinol methylase|uniref:Ubiquinone/menaquinone biosynthesis C-methylase UbiE n=1 Tax=Gelidibacter algens TaxID=49280 RepID=A0A327S8Q9_9FLAO|nr:class I SAM-dependent methyltransferase [Gelidibacter algens]RAJ25158.1 ubiquinone/menaquinone biosynthesis C-methylase UbiE [Gelidibacter algens]